MLENHNILDGISKDSIVLNADNVSPTLILKHSQVILNRNYWHAFLIHNVKNPKRNETLKIILNYVYPEALLPILFQSRGSDCTFLARNCSGAIYKLLRNNLVIPDPSDASSTYPCEIILMYSSISKFSLPPNNISKTLQLLYEDSSKTLNLEKFADNKELEEYYPLSQPKLLCFVLRLSDKMKPACINLKGNEIRTLSPFEVLRGTSSIQRLDLRNNLIEDIEELNHLKIFDVVELCLDGNPLCDKYDSFSYIKSIKKILPMMEKLDGVSIQPFQLPEPQRSFLCSNEGFDLVDQFVSHFFSLYDTERKFLVDLYHPSAIFSMTAEGYKNIEENDRLLIYKAYTRNLLSSNPSVLMAVTGNERISNTFCKLPQTKHNMHTFSVDLIYYSDSSAVLSVSGTFCEDLKRKLQPDFVFGFKRTFTLVKDLYNYVISNDLLHIHKSSEFQTRDALENQEKKKISPSRLEAEKNMVEEAMSRITGVHRAWLKRLLEDADYNIIEFLTSFVALAKENKIPEQAYSQNNQHSFMEWLVPKMMEFGMEKFDYSLHKEALEYIKANPSLQKNINLPSSNTACNIVDPQELQRQLWMQKYRNLNLPAYKNNENSAIMNSNYTKASDQFGYQNYLTMVQKCQFPLPQTCMKSQSNTCKSTNNIDKDRIEKPHESSHRRSNLVIVETDKTKVDKIHKKNNSANEQENPLKCIEIEPVKSIISAGQKKKEDLIHRKCYFAKEKKNSIKDIEIYPVKTTISAGEKKKETIIQKKNNSVNEQDNFIKCIKMEPVKSAISANQKKIHKRNNSAKEQENSIIHERNYSATEQEDSIECIDIDPVESSVSGVKEDLNRQRPTVNTIYECEENSSESNSKEHVEEYIDVDIHPTWALVNRKWINIEDYAEYDFQLAFNKWILVQKDREGKCFPKQDDFQKNFTCWKKHFPTYPNEILSHSLHSSCISSQLKWAFDTIQYPITYWDFPASVPEDIRPPKYGILQGVEKSITPVCGYSFIYVQKKWILVKKNLFDQWVMVNNEKKVVWECDKWVVKPLLTEEKITEHNEPERDTFEIFEDEDVFGESELEEIKKIYEEDVHTEKSITTSNYEFQISQRNKNETTRKRDMLIKWKKIFEFIPYVPRIAFIKGNSVVVRENPNLKFQWINSNKWVLLEKHSQTNKWREVNDDFRLYKYMSTKEESLAFDHIPMPVTIYDFPRTSPLGPPDKLLIDGKVVLVTPDSGYAYVSVGGEWYPVKKNKQNQWVAVQDAHRDAVRKKLANMPSEFLTVNETSVPFETEDDKKISSVRCTLLQLLTGLELVKPLTHWDIGGPEEERPPKIALTEIDGEQRWYCVTPGCGKGFVLEDDVWVKVVCAEPGKWKATRLSAYEGCIVGYHLFQNVWVTMKKHILGGKWSPLFNLETTPTTYWNYIGPEESKPPRQIIVDNTMKIIHNNTNMGFIMKENAWILMENESNNWRISMNNQKFSIYKLFNGMWKLVEKDSVTGNWSHRPASQKIFHFQNFNGLMKCAPPKQVCLLKGGNKIQKVVHNKSGMGFLLYDGVWVLMQKMCGKFIPVKSSKGQTSIGYKRFDGKFRIIQMDKNGEWINSKDENKQKVEDNKKPTSIQKKFKYTTPLTHDRILVDFPNSLKPPKYALIKDLIENKIRWHLIDMNSRYGFVRAEDTWLLMKWTEKWENASDEVEYRYKAIDNSWIPLKNENNSWVPIFDPKTTPKVPALCIESPEKDLPNEILVQSDTIKSKINITPTSGMGFMRISNEYVLMEKMFDGKWVMYKDHSNNALILKQKDYDVWETSTRNIKSFDVDSVNSDRIDSNEEIKTFDNTPGGFKSKPPRYIKIIEEGSLRWKKITQKAGFGFIMRTYWMLVKKIKKNWVLVNKDEGYEIIENRWVLMKKTREGWSPSFNPSLIPRTRMDTIEDRFCPIPVRVVTFKNGHAKYINTANDCSLGFICDSEHVYVLMKEIDGKWIKMEDDFEETSTMAFKCMGYIKWRRMKKSRGTGPWIMCRKQFDLPVLPMDLGNTNNKPPLKITIIDSNHKAHKINFTIFSDEGFVQDSKGVWVLMKPNSDNTWSRYPGIFGSYGYEVHNDKTILMVEKNGPWVENDKVEQRSEAIRIDYPITYEETANLPEEERPPKEFRCPGGSYTGDNGKTILMLEKNGQREKHGHGSDALSIDYPITYEETEDRPEEERPPREFRCLGAGENQHFKYGFVKHKDVWVVVKHDGNSWQFEKSCGDYEAYKLMKDRWVPMRLLQNEWIPSFDPSNTPYHYHTTAGKFEEKPPIRINLDDHWRLTYDHDKIGFNRNGDIWEVMEKDGMGIWTKYSDNPSIGYKIVDGQWREFEKVPGGTWKIGSYPSLPVLACDFIPGHKNAPPSSLCFGYSAECVMVKHTDVGPCSDKGFIESNGAWVLMANKGVIWYKFNRFPWLKGSFAYIRKNDVWKIAMKDFDGSWKCGSINTNGQWSYENQPIIPLKTPMAINEIVPAQSEKVLPHVFVIFDDLKPKKVSLMSVAKIFRFQYHKGVWVLLKFNGYKWNFPGGVVAYLMINNRWVTMTMNVDTWVPSYDPNTTPITHFECVGPIDSRPPLRIVLNQNGKDRWKVIFQHSGYGFIKQGCLWVLMRIQCDGTWIEHLDCFQDLTGYKMVDLKWERFQRKKNGKWKVKGPFMPSLQCDYSLAHHQIPPPLFHDFIKNPQVTCESSDSYLHLYSKFGYRLVNDVWILQESDSSGSWSDHKFYPSQTYRFGIKASNVGWMLMKKMGKGWVEGVLQHSGNNTWTFIRGGMNLVQQRFTSLIKNRNERKNRNGRKNRNERKMKRRVRGKGRGGRGRRSKQTQKDQNVNVEDNIKRNEIRIKQEAKDDNEQKRKREIIDLTGEVEDSNGKQGTGKRKKKEQAEMDKTVKVEDIIEQNEIEIKQENEGSQEPVESLSGIFETEANIKKQHEIINKNEREVVDLIEEVVGDNKGQQNEHTIEDKNEQLDNTYGPNNENGQEVEDTNKQVGNSQLHTENEHKIEEIKSENHSWEIPITNPVKYHELTGIPIEEKPPRSVCLIIRGVPRRISLVSKTSKIGFQLHNGVWVLLERLSGTWKILHNSAGMPLAYKLIDNRWISMRIDKNGSWVCTFNPATTPQTFYDTEGSDDAKPPRRVILNENGVLKWKDIADFSGFGFLKKNEMWILMQKGPNGCWVEYVNSEQETCAFKIQDFKWTKFTKRPEDDSWKVSVEDLPVLHYDFVDKSFAAPPEFTDRLLKSIKGETTNVGFLWSSGAWVLMERDESDKWTPATGCYGLVRTSADLWNVVSKDGDGKWTKKVKQGCVFESALDAFQLRGKRGRDIVECIHKKKLKPSDPEGKIGEVIGVASSEAKNENVTSSTENSTLRGDNNEHTKHPDIEVNPCESIGNTQEQNETNSCSAEISTIDHNSCVEDRRIESDIPKEMHTEDQKVAPKESEWNVVERYLALNPECCSGCPELQNLLRVYRPPNVPNKIFRKRFRLPDGSTRRLTIPKAVPPKQTESREEVEKIGGVDKKENET